MAGSGADPSFRERLAPTDQGAAGTGAAVPGGPGPAPGLGLPQRTQASPFPAFELCRGATAPGRGVNPYGPGFFPRHGADNDPVFRPQSFPGRLPAIIKSF